MGWLGDEAYTGWWLLPECDRNCGKLLSASGMPYEYGNIYPKAVFPNGEIGFHGRNIFHSDFMIRPCILLNVYRDKMTTGSMILRIYRLLPEKSEEMESENVAFIMMFH